MDDGSDLILVFHFVRLSHSHLTLILIAALIARMQPGSAQDILQDHGGVRLLMIDHVLALQQNRPNANDLYNPTRYHSAKEKNCLTPNLPTLPRKPVFQSFSRLRI